MNFTKPTFDKNLLGLLILAVVSIVILAIRGSGNEFIQTGQREPFTIQSAETIWPGVKNKNLLGKEVEYSPSPNPQMHNAYCVYNYSGDLQVYQFIGQSGYKDGFNLDCPNT